MKAPAYFLPLFLPVFFVPSTAFTGVLHAQAPAAGASVSVKMLDTVNSGSDPAGKQYRASVTKPVDAGNGVTIAQGAAATVTLTRSGSDYAAQLSSLTINGQQVAVTSNSATVSAVAQYAQEKVASAVSSVLGGFGHHVSAPASVAAAATASTSPCPQAPRSPSCSVSRRRRLPPRRLRLRLRARPLRNLQRHPGPRRART
jgi:sulfur carrier protein ThiS